MSSKKSFSSLSALVLKFLLIHENRASLICSGVFGYRVSIINFVSGAFGDF